MQNFADLGISGAAVPSLFTKFGSCMRQWTHHSTCANFHLDRFIIYCVSYVGAKTQNCTYVVKSHVTYIDFVMNRFFMSRSSPFVGLSVSRFVRWMSCEKMAD